MSNEVVSQECERPLSGRNAQEEHDPVPFDTDVDEKKLVEQWWTYVGNAIAS